MSSSRGYYAVALSTLLLASGAWAVNEPIPRPQCNASMPISIRYANTTKRLYLEGDGDGCVTLGQIYEARKGKAPLYAMNATTGERVANATGVWLLTEDLYIEDGITLNVHGSDYLGGDADELRLLSTPDTVINLRAHGGSMSFINTKVSSWDEAANTYDTNVTDGRSYISAISEIITDANATCSGAAKKTMGEARMDINASDIGYLGYFDSESYGLTWKVRGFCKDKSNPEVFDEVNVYGNIYDSKIHHNFFGMYTYGHQQGDWRRNEMYENIEYGFDPHDDSDLLNIHDNKVWGNGNHGIIASKRCNNVSIQNNEVYNGGNAGLFLHRSSDDAIVRNNHVYNNGDAGLALLESFRADVSDNIFENNKYGIRFSVGSTDNVFSNNLIANSTKYNVFSYEGSDLPDVSPTGRSQNNVFRENTMTYAGETIKLKESDYSAFINNVFVNATDIRVANSTEVLMVNNTGLDSVELKVRGYGCFNSDSDEEFEPTC